MSSLVSYHNNHKSENIWPSQIITVKPVHKHTHKQALFCSLGGHTGGERGGKICLVPRRHPLIGLLPSSKALSH